jgi:hypothetical protein
MHIVALILFSILGIFLLFVLGVLGVTWIFMGDREEEWLEHWERMRGRDE